MPTDLEREIRETLRKRAEQPRAPLQIPESVRRRARRRRMASAIGSSLVVAGIVAGAVVGTRALLAPTAAPSEIQPAGPDAEAFAVWPQTTKEEAEAAQACADRGDESCTWQLSALEVVRRYGDNKLGWNQVFFFVQGFSNEYLLLPLEGETQDLGLVDVVDPLTVRIAECLPPQIGECRTARLRVEKPLRPDVTGIWLITEAEEASVFVQRPVGSDAGPLPDAVVDFLQRFMESRQAGEGAERFLTDSAVNQYERGDGGLSLYGYAPDGRYRISGETLPTNGPAAYQASIRIQVGERTIEEALLIEERPDGVETGPEWRDLMVIGVQRAS
jgi:hypothetical protein